MSDVSPCSVCGAIPTICDECLEKEEHPLIESVRVLRDELDRLKMLLTGIKCDLNRSVVPDTVEKMVVQCISDRAALLRQVDELKRELHRYPLRQTEPKP